jgi:methylated-DNA-protein-cysteine methyltransferase-like protein
MPNPTQKNPPEDARLSLFGATPAQRREALYLCLASIPPGYVVSYGQLAAMAGLGRAARWAARTLSQLPEGSSLPWHRVITASGRPGLSLDSAAGQEQRQRLRTEGLILRNDRVDMRTHGWRQPPA